MGEAKRRGSYESRKIEGEIKRKLEMERVESERENLKNALTPEQKLRHVQILGAAISILGNGLTKKILDN